MRKIWKFPVELNSVLDQAMEFTIDMPDGATLLHVGVQNGQACLWAEINPDAPKKPYLFYSVGTGHGSVPEDGAYLGTAILPTGFVFHVYKCVK